MLSLQVYLSALNCLFPPVSGKNPNSSLEKMDCRKTGGKDKYKEDRGKAQSNSSSSVNHKYTHLHSTKIMSWQTNLTVPCFRNAEMKDWHRLHQACNTDTRVKSIPPIKVTESETKKNCCFWSACALLRQSPVLVQVLQARHWCLGDGATRIDYSTRTPSVAIQGSLCLPDQKSSDSNLNEAEP